MINVDPLAGEVSTTTVRQRSMPVIERVTVTPIPSSTHLLHVEGEWSWTELRDYVIQEIQRRHGPQTRNPKTEAAIFKSFLSRHPDGRAIHIAKAAFEIYDGMWANAPISVNRFCRASDDFFAIPILTRLEK